MEEFSVGQKVKSKNFGIWEITYKYHPYSGLDIYGNFIFEQYPRYDIESYPDHIEQCYLHNGCWELIK